MKHLVTSRWTGNMSFSADVDGHEVKMEGNAEEGNERSAASPKKLLLAALGGCTGLDIVSLLKKMRVNFTGLDVKVSGELRENAPWDYYKMHVVYTVKGENLPLDKIERAVELSERKYCGVEATLKNGLVITSEIKLVD